ncbi:hypothetical protein [Comamonas thiooxydans]|uniref:hypothetical protein n=1 Tax=Comamonas thiooxydans TaxID=363952 RepID=UPI000B40A652|nr:hypothetical protein [Comamonas thiooxydans]
MEFAAISIGFLVGVVIGFLLVGGVCFVLYLQALRKFQSLQADLAGKAVSLVKDQVVGATVGMAKGYLSRKVQPGNWTR